MPGPGGSAPDRARRVVGIDLGERRIGVAVGDLATGTATPFVTLSRGKSVAEDAVALSRLATEQAAGLLVVGLPLDMDGGEGAQATRTREWAEAIAAATGLPLRYRDERLTSERAERRIGPPGRGRSGGPPGAAQREAYRARVDREAAALILQDELDATADEKPERDSQ
ncbi:MAG: Holliday junction resolvase RuvX [Candidatus Limnocylindrales bacterium]